MEKIIKGTGRMGTDMARGSRRRYQDASMKEDGCRGRRRDMEDLAFRRSNFMKEGLKMELRMVLEERSLKTEMLIKANT